MTTQPLIGVTVPRNYSYLTWHLAAKAIENAGGKLVRLSVGKPVPMGLLSGFLFGAVEKFSIKRYNNKLHFALRLDAMRDMLDREIMLAAEEFNLPVFGMGRGMDVVNDYYNGSSKIDREIILDDGLYAHALMQPIRIQLNNKSRNALNFNRESLAKGYHTPQGLFLENMGDGLSILARDIKKNTVAIEDPKRSFLVASRWFPHLAKSKNRELHAPIFKAFIDKAKEVGVPDSEKLDYMRKNSPEKLPRGLRPLPNARIVTKDIEEETEFK